MSTSSDYLRMAVPLMVRREIPPTPYNYALWYAHVQNGNSELSKALLDSFPGPGTYDHEKSESLFFEFFIKNYLPNNPRAQNLLVNIVAQLAKSVSRSAKATENYESSLKEAIDLFEAEVDQPRIQETLSRLLTDTNTIERLNTDFQTELQSARLEVEALKKELEKTRYSARFDTLTKIANRRGFDDVLTQSLNTTDEPTCLMLLDLDHFKACNDTYGHPMGDRILEIVGNILEGYQSETVFVARYGGEEFAVIVNDHIAIAQDIAEAIRLKVAAIQVRRKNTRDLIGAITISIGLAQATPGETPEDLIERADAALYRAKDSGRNRVVLAESREAKRA